MPRSSEWSISEDRTLGFDAPRVEELQVRLVSGLVNVVGTDEPTTRVEITEVKGPPLIVRQEGGTLSVAYDDLPWKGFLKWLDRKGWHRSAVVSVSVPADVRLTVGLVGASAVVSRIAGRTDVRGVSGDTTLVGLSGDVHAETVSGALEAQGVSGRLRFSSVSGGLTVIDHRSPRLSADSVSGDMVVDLAPSALPLDLRLNTVSGEVAVRLPEEVSAGVSASTASGAVSSAFAELSAVGGWGARQLTGTLGSGAGSVSCTSVSGSLALLRRPPAERDSPPAASLRKDA
ncbi:DUF4097 family beta strand repeat-containing protein [Streptomyces hainanensis]|nr:DUF4097 family beta strand repeat-containing protein [Streptomyces hainanensis]